MKIKIMLFFCLGVASIDMLGGLNHVCAYTEPSVVKFREKNRSCAIDNFTGKSKVLFDWPIDLCRFWISSLFGPREHRGVIKQHGGTDMAAQTGTPVLAAATGKVLLAAPEQKGFGNMIEIQHKNNLVTRYAHLDEMLVRPGAKVKLGQQIATVGATGNVRGKKDASHLHFEILKNGKRQDPLLYLYCSELEFAR